MGLLHNRRLLWAMALLATLIGLSLAGCSANGGQASTHGTATASPTATAAPPTATPLPTMTNSNLPKSCNQAYGTTFVQTGDLYVGVTLTNVSYPSAKLPDGIPLKPYKINETNPGFPQEPVINPNVDTGLFLYVCNASKTASHTIDGVHARIDAFTPYTGDLDAYQPCDGWYKMGQVAGTGCGGGFTANEFFAAKFAATAGAGATVTAAFVRAGMDLNGNPVQPIPLTLQPGGDALMVVSLTPPTAAGYYTFSFATVVDNTATPFVPDASDQILLDPNARNWTGKACQAPQMQSQIPPNSSDAYICPAA